MTEDGHFTLDKKIDSELTKTVEKNNAKVYELFYKDKTLENGNVMRLYKLRDKVDLVEMYSGQEPAKENEISVDRLYARNNDISIGDKINIDGRDFKVTGFSTAPDYTSLYKNNTDFMFDALTFCVGFMTDEGFDSLDDTGIKYNYAWVYNDRGLDEDTKHDKAEKLMNALSDRSQEITEAIRQAYLSAMLSGNLKSFDLDISEEDMPPTLTDFIPSDSNSAINMATEDVGGDKIIVMWLLYITIAVIALATAITTKSTVEQEAGVIGTLRASGYRRGELIGHYMIIPVFMTLVAALLGNVLGYTFMNDVCASMYYGSYSFPAYVPQINAEALLLTTFVPAAIVLLIEVIMLVRLISLPPLQFLRRELKKNKSSGSLPLKAGGFTLRFRTRIILRNYQAYIVLFVGILFANLLLMFSLIWTPLLSNFKDVILDNMIAENQYILKAQAKTKDSSAEKFALYSLTNENGEDISIYGISNGSKYVSGLDLSDGKIAFSSAYSEKYNIHPGDTVTFSERFSSQKYELKVGEIYDYPPSLCVFMSLDNFRTTFDEDDDYFTGYFSDKKLDDIDKNYIAAVIGRNDLTNSADQLENSVGFVKLFAIFAIAVYILMIYILSKMITERNSRSISVLKILGYKSNEISGLYNFSTGAVVLISMAVSIPLLGLLMKYLYFAVMQNYNGWVSFFIAPEIYPEMAAIGCLCFLAAYLLEMRRIRRIAMNEAIKDIE